MESQNTNSNPQQETDILVLFEYFKKGIKGIFKWIYQLFRSLFRAILWVILLLKRNMILVASIIAVFVVFSFFKKQLLGEKFSYSITIKPNYGSTESIYKWVESIKSQVNQPGEFNFVQDIDIKPVKSINSEIDVYYSIIGDDFDTNSGIKQSNDRDTIIFRQLKFEEYQAKIDDKDFKVHEINIKSSKKLSKEDIYKIIVAPIEKNIALKRIKETYLKSLDLNITMQERALAKIDTLLAQVTNRPQESNSFSMKGEGKSNVEEDLLNQYNKYSGNIISLNNKKALYSDVITVLSEGSRVSSKRISDVSVIGYALYGLLSALLLLFGIQIWKYLGTLEKKQQA